ncbi:Gfo/Idh/MocA family protein [Saccharibacillus sp. JS10]|uniref:Gfo/Idh/MocA family protein n=1 Tax=Saccharibacillus sp. JS10 TaxID=2950552 RepID=UPI00210D200B|nr:Gfo/Idh/MocA family oxidoreductase [Saccharibacillus sp. JS10]MCQ4087642.1 Gfo/Idh/MocA family oxidoreductase [Saccharibacillus sp. JS10]
MIKWGILGAGNIAYRFAAALVHEPNSTLYAISGRNENKLKTFADHYPVHQLYLSHDELLADPEIDAIYLALPHQLHREWAIQAIDAGKAVLCEKPAALHAEEMQDIADAARSRNVLFMEAMKPRFVPLYRELRRRVDAGEIGAVMSIETSFCDKIQLDKATYHTEPDHGGALLDIGTYCASWIEDFSFGDMRLESIRSEIQDSVELYVDARLETENVRAQLQCAFDRKKDRIAVLRGEKGHIVVEDLHRPTRLTVYRDGQEPEIVEIPYEVDDFYSEIHHFVQCLEQGLTESDIMPLSASLRCAEILDVVRAGIR